MLGMLADTDNALRLKAVKMILNYRQHGSKAPQSLPESEMLNSDDDDDDDGEPNKEIDATNQQVRFLKVPQLNFDTSSYNELISWDNLSEPPLTMHFTNDELEDIVTKPLSVCKYLCHNQSVERCVKEVSAAASKVIGEKAREGFVRMRLKSRKLMPKRETK